MKSTIGLSVLKYSILSLQDVTFYAKTYMSRDMRFPIMWYVQPAKAQTSLHIPPV